MTTAMGHQAGRRASGYPTNNAGIPTYVIAPKAVAVPHLGLPLLPWAITGSLSGQNRLVAPPPPSPRAAVIAQAAGPDRRWTCHRGAEYVDALKNSADCEAIRLEDVVTAGTVRETAGPDERVFDVRLI